MAEGWESYILGFYRGIDGRLHSGTIANGDGKPSQYMRMVCAQRLGLRTWDWKVDPRTKVIQQTLAIGFVPNQTVLFDATTAPAQRERELLPGTI